jgi:hypothetical protein
MYSTIFIVCGAALWQGGEAERYVAAAFLVNFGVNSIQTARAVISGVAVAPFDPTISLVTDLVLLAVLLAVALSYKPVWTLFVAAFQLLATLTSVVRLTDPDVSPLAYITAQNTLWWLSLAVLAIGVAERVKARRREHSVTPPPPSVPASRVR